MEYEPNPKHKQPWQRGRTGTLCPTNIDSAGLLAGSSLVGRKRYATDGQRAYCAQQHQAGKWHGYPEDWRNVPEKLWRDWLDEQVVNRSSIKRYW